jgi:hypothetical protein
MTRDCSKQDKAWPPGSHRRRHFISCGITRKHFPGLDFVIYNEHFGFGRVH